MPGPDTFNIKKARKIDLAISEMKELEKTEPVDIYLLQEMNEEGSTARATAPSAVYKDKELDVIVEVLNNMKSFVKFLRNSSQIRLYLYCLLPNHDLSFQINSTV